MPGGFPLAVIRGMLPTDPLPLAAAADRCPAVKVCRPFRVKGIIARLERGTWLGQPELYWKGKHERRTSRQFADTSSRPLWRCWRRSSDQDWLSVTLEPDHVSEKIDILWQYPGKTKAVQVKSSVNPFEDAAVKGWAQRP